jgi:hypothetical protein
MFKPYTLSCGHSVCDNCVRKVNTPTHYPVQFHLACPHFLGDEQLKNFKCPFPGKLCRDWKDMVVIDSESGRRLHAPEPSVRGRTSLRILTSLWRRSVATDVADGQVNLTLQKLAEKVFPKHQETARLKGRGNQRKFAGALSSLTCC